MVCSSRYAEAWEYGNFFCIGNLVAGNHGGAGPADVALEDTNKNFIQFGARPNIGQVLYNLTQVTSGVVTAVTDTTITAFGVTWNALDEYRISTMDATELATSEHYLNIIAVDITIALRSIAACDCTWWTEFSAWAKKINIIEAAVLHKCPCASPSLSDVQMQLLLQWADQQLESLRKMEFDPCDGHTGKDFPYTGWAEQSITQFSAATIVFNDILRDSS